MPKHGENERYETADEFIIRILGGVLQQLNCIEGKVDQVMTQEQEVESVTQDLLAQVGNLNTANQNLAALLAQLNSEIANDGAPSESTVAALQSAQQQFDAAVAATQALIPTDPGTPVQTDPGTPAVPTIPPTPVTEGGNS